MNEVKVSSIVVTILTKATEKVGNKHDIRVVAVYAQQLPHESSKCKKEMSKKAASCINCTCSPNPFSMYRFMRFVLAY